MKSKDTAEGHAEGAGRPVPEAGPAPWGGLPVTVLRHGLCRPSSGSAVNNQGVQNPCMGLGRGGKVVLFLLTQIPRR